MFVSDLVTVAVAGKDGIEYARDFVDDKRGCAELDAFEQRFADVLQKAIQNTLPGDVVKETFEQKHKQILSTLENIDISDTNSAPIRLCDEITNQIINELDIDSIDRDELQEAVETAYRAALDEFLDEIPDRDVDRWLLESSKDTQKKLGDIDNRLQELRTDLSYRDDLMGRIEPFERIDATDDGWVDRVAVELGVEVERELPFQEPTEFNSVIDEQFALVIGRAGLGKSRTLIEAIEEIACQATFDLAVVISGKIDDPADFDSLARTDVDGDVLLIWDDLHQVTGDQIVSDSIDRLKNEFDRKGVDLHVRGAVRSEHLDAVLPENWGIEELQQPADLRGRYPIWGEFKPVELESFDAENLDEFVRDALDNHDLTADDDIIEAFVKRVLEADPTPFYVDTICRTTTGNKITKSNIERFPENALTSWKTAYKALPHDGRYNESRDILHTLSILDVLNVSSDEMLVEDVFFEVFSGENFQEQIGFLTDRGWITTKRIDFDTNVIIHDVRLEAIAENYSLEDYRHDVRSLSNFLQDNMIDYYDDDLGAILNTNFAEYIFNNQIGRRPNQLAKQHFERAMELNEETPIVYRKYAHFLSRQNLAEIIDSVYKQAIDSIPSDISLRRGYAHYLSDQDRHEEALRQYERAIEIEPSDVLLRISYAEELANQKGCKHVGEQYEQAIDITPENRLLRRKYAEYLANQDKHKEARKQYEQAINIKPDDIVRRDWYANYLANQGKHKEACKQYERIIEIQPENALNRTSYAHYLANQDKHEEAGKQYEQAIDIEPDHPDIRTGYANCLASQDKHKEARKQYEQAINIKPNDVMTYITYARYLADKNENRKARKQYEQAIKIQPNDGLTRYVYAMHLANQDDHDETCKQYVQAIDIEPDDNWYRLSYIKYLTRQNEHNKIRKQYEEAIDFNPRNTSYRTRYAEYLANQDKHKKARKQYEQALNIEPGNTDLRCSYARYLSNQDDHLEARNQFEKAIDTAPGYPVLRKLYAEYLASQDDHDGARKQYEQAIDIEPGNTNICEQYADYLADQGNYEEARKYRN